MGNYHVRFLGGGGPAMDSCYPTSGPRPTKLVARGNVQQGPRPLNCTFGGAGGWISPTYPNRTADYWRKVFPLFWKNTPCSSRDVRL